MAQKLTEAELGEFKAVTQKPYAQQCKFFLNAFWVECGKEAEKIWTWCNKFIQLDHENGKEGHDLDEFNAHRFLEQLGETMRVVELRETLRQFDLSFRRLSLIEYLLYAFKQTIKVLLSRPQGTNELLIKAQQALDAVQSEIQKIEKKKSDLEKKAAGSGVAANAAKNELQQLLSAPQTELNKAMLSAEAAVRKAQKAEGMVAPGHVWWMDRELAEAKKYKPQKKATTN
eukprot:TRINITY_DN10854_c0_g1_i1.p1 TRINITY_DN10854_c0_g1~~TRINITY_DN10854_c0_g1_i1.p1  ORF type:complete len:229 (+),score=63.12 TRINITY_DN10854_c0_g1_i1:126-812(+)